MTDYLSFDIACQRLGQAMWGDEYIERVPPKARWILEQVGPAKRLSSITGRSVGYFGEKRHEVPKPHPAISAEEARQAVQLLHRFEWGVLEASKWLDARSIKRRGTLDVRRPNFRLDNLDVLASDFEREFAKAFTAVRQVPPKLKAGRKRALTDQTIAKMRKAFPGGKPNDVTYDVIRADYGLTVSDKTIREMLRQK